LCESTPFLFVVAFCSKANQQQGEPATRRIADMAQSNMGTMSYMANMGSSNLAQTNMGNMTDDWEASRSHTVWLDVTNSSWINFQVARGGIRHVKTNQHDNIQNREVLNEIRILKYIHIHMYLYIYILIQITHKQPNQIGTFAI
jgi:hypothetical protein